MTAQILTQKPTKRTKLDLEAMKEKDREKVRGIFRFHEVPGGCLSFVYAAYKGENPERYDLVDGEQYTVPLGVARHLNKNVWYPIHAQATDIEGRITFRVNQKIRRCSFQSLEFVDIEDLTPEGASLVTVEKMAPSIAI